MDQIIIERLDRPSLVWKTCDNIFIFTIIIDGQINTICHYTSETNDYTISFNLCKNSAKNDKDVTLFSPDLQVKFIV